MAFESETSEPEYLFIRQGPSGPAFRTRAAGALGTTGHSRSQYQVHQEGQENGNQV